jgi:hypothetical protein
MIPLAGKQPDGSPDFVALLTSAHRRPIRLSDPAFASMDLLARRFDLMFLQTGVITRDD